MQITISFNSENSDWCLLEPAIRHCQSKGAVLERVAEILDTISPPTPTFNPQNGAREITVLITTQVEAIEPDFHMPTLDVRKSVEHAIQEAVEFIEGEGFTHQLADDVTVGIAAVNALCVD
jgi:hypothetical protein